MTPTRSDGRFAHALNAAARQRAAFINVDDARRRARCRLPRAVFDFVDGGAEDELTMADNRRAFEDVRFRPRMAVEVPAGVLATELLGTPLEVPILFAPCGLMGAVRPDAEPTLARAAEQVGTIAAFSTYSNTTLEQIAAASSAPKWFQLYFLGGRSGAEHLVDRAQAAGYHALVVTVDTNVTGSRERDLRNRVSYPVRVGWREAIRFGPQVAVRPAWLYRLARAGFQLRLANEVPPPGDVADDAVPAGRPGSLFEATPTWADLGWIRDRWHGPIVIKGILTGDDARRAVDAGADAVVVSNHGGRQLDGVPGTLRVLPEVARAVGDDVEVLLDGGVRRGSDVAKALSLGARAVLIGRPYLYGLAAAGERGVSRVVEVLTEELTRTLQLLGCPSVTELGPQWLWAEAGAPLAGPACSVGHEA